MRVIINVPLNKNRFALAVKKFLWHAKIDHTSMLLQEMMHLGFEYGTRLGISLSPEDFRGFRYTLPLTKARQNLSNYSLPVGLEGYLSSSSRSDHSRAERSRRAFGSFKLFLEHFSTVMPVPNALYLLARTGARGSVSQLRQLIGYRGLVFNLKGRVCGEPIAGGLIHGLTLHEYFLSCYGARKGVLDTALKTSEAGYLTRKTVESTQKLTIRERQCVRPVLLKYPLVSNVNVVGDAKPIEFLILEGKYSGKNIIDPVSQTVIISNSVPLNRKLLLFAQSHNLTFMHFYSPLSCEGLVCQRCYGIERMSGKTIRLGEAVGTMAGQSIGEPATQLVLRTFHTGGIFESYGAQRILSSANYLRQTFSAYAPYSTLHLMGTDRASTSSALTNPLRYKIHSKHLTCIFNFEQSTLQNFSWLPIRHGLTAIGSVCKRSNRALVVALETDTLGIFSEIGSCCHISDRTFHRDPSWLCSSSPLRSLVRNSSWQKWTSVESVGPLGSGELFFKDCRIALARYDKGWSSYVLQHSLGHTSNSFTATFPGCYGLAVKSRLSGFGHNHYLGFQRLVSLETFGRRYTLTRTSLNAEQMWFVKRYKIFSVNSHFSLVSEKGRITTVDSAPNPIRFVRLESGIFSRSRWTHGGKIGKLWVARGNCARAQYLVSLVGLIETKASTLDINLQALLRYNDWLRHFILGYRVRNIIGEAYKLPARVNFPVVIPGNLENYVSWATEMENTVIKATRKALTLVQSKRLEAPSAFIWGPLAVPGCGTRCEYAELIPHSKYSYRKMSRVLGESVNSNIDLRPIELRDILCVRAANEHGTNYVFTHEYQPTGHVYHPVGEFYQMYQMRDFNTFAKLLIFKIGSAVLSSLTSFPQAYTDHSYLWTHSDDMIEAAVWVPVPGLIDYLSVMRLSAGPGYKAHDDLTDIYEGKTPILCSLPLKTWLCWPATFRPQTLKFEGRKPGYVLSTRRDIVGMEPFHARNQLKVELGSSNAQMCSSYSNSYKNLVFGSRRKLVRLNMDPQNPVTELNVNHNALLQDAHSVINFLPHQSVISGRLSKLKCHSTGTAQTISALFDYHHKPFVNLGTSQTQPGLRRASGFIIRRASNLHRWLGENVTLFSSLSHQATTHISRGPVVRGRLHRIISDWRKQKTSAMVNKLVYPKWLPWTPAMQLTHYPSNSSGGSGRDIILGIQVVDAIIENRIPIAKVALASFSGVNRAIPLSKILSSRVRRSLYEFQSFIPPSIDSSISNSTHVHIFYSGQPIEAGLASVSASVSQICEAQFSFQGVFTANKLSLLFGQQLLSRSLFRQYVTQGIKVPSVHFELIARRMASCVRVVSLGQVHCSVGDIVPLGVIHILNQAAIKHGYQSCSYRPVIIGVSKSVLLNTGFLSSASFQEPVKALTKFSLESGVDWCMDLKARVMMGRMLSSGTGLRSLTQTRARRVGWKPTISLKHVFSSFRIFNRE